MTVAWRSYTYLTTTSRTNVTVVVPSGVVAGDKLICEIAVGNSGTVPTVTPPAGWTLLGSSPYAITGGGYNQNDSLYYRDVTGTEPTDYLFEFTSAVSGATMFAISGAATGAPSLSYATGTGSTTTAASITTTSAGALVAFVATNWRDPAGDPGSTPPTGTTPTFTERIDIIDETYLYVATGVMSTPGATGTKTYTNTGTVGGDPWSAWLIDFEPLVTGGTGTVTATLGAATSVAAGVTGFHGATAGTLAAATIVATGTVTTGPAPTITLQPSSQSIYAGATATFTVAATASAGSLTYQWKVGGVNVTGGSGATTASYTTATRTVGNSGASYTVVVTDSNNSITSNAAILTVTTAPLLVRVRLYDGITAQASLTGLTALWWDSITPDSFGAPVAATAAEATDGSGWLEIDISGVTSLAAGASGFLLLYKAGATAALDSVFAGRLIVTEGT